MLKTQTTFLLAVVMALVLNGCVATQTAPASAPNSPLTHGNVQLTLKNGITTQNEVVEKFGAPNIVTYDASGNEVWTYQKHATVANASSSSSYATIILFGGSQRSSGFEQSQKTMTLVIKFDKNKVVSDFKSMYTSF